MCHPNAKYHTHYACCPHALSHTHTCIYTPTCTRVHTHIYIYIDTQTPTYTLTHTHYPNAIYHTHHTCHPHALSLTHVHAHLYIYIDIHPPTCTRACPHTHTHTHTNANTHISSPTPWHSAHIPETRRCVISEHFERPLLRVHVAWKSLEGCNKIVPSAMVQTCQQTSAPKWKKRNPQKLPKFSFHWSHFAYSIVSIKICSLIPKQNKTNLGHYFPRKASSNRIMMTSS